MVFSPNGRVDTFVVARRCVVYLFAYLTVAYCAALPIDSYRKPEINESIDMSFRATIML